MIQVAFCHKPLERQDIDTVDLSNPGSHETLAVERYVVESETSRRMLPLFIVYGKPQSILQEIRDC